MDEGCTATSECPRAERTTGAPHPRAKAEPDRGDYRKVMGTARAEAVFGAWNGACMRLTAGGCVSGSGG